MTNRTPAASTGSFSARTPEPAGDRTKNAVSDGTAPLTPLPAEPFEYAEWKRCRAGLDYRVEVHGHWYSVPYWLIREVVEARITDRTVEVFHHGVLVAVHVRNPVQHRHTTVPDHMPNAHRRYATGRQPGRDARPARIGPASAHLGELILAAKPHPEQGFRACLG